MCVTAARILSGSPTTPLSDKRLPNSTLNVPGDRICLFYAFHISLLGQFLSITNLRKAIVSNMPIKLRRRIVTVH
uniref:Uncharacterized protein n=1 Tax=Amphimedon queenslandica TaxID=400682 RepID=A0A1X7V6I3_AMPQE